MGPNLQKFRKKSSNQPFFEGEKSSDMGRGFRLRAALPRQKIIRVSPGCEIDPKMGVFACFFFLIRLSCPFQNYVNMTKNTPFFQFCTSFAPLNDVRTSGTNVHGPEKQS